MRCNKRTAQLNIVADGSGAVGDEVDALSVGSRFINCWPTWVGWNSQGASVGEPTGLSNFAKTAAQQQVGSAAVRFQHRRPELCKEVRTSLPCIWQSEQPSVASKLLRACRNVQRLQLLSRCTGGTAWCRQAEPKTLQTQGVPR